MSHRLRRRSWPWRIAALILAVVSLAVGLCLFDDDGSGTDEHAVARDLCSGLLVSSSLTVTLLALAGLNRVHFGSLHPACVVSLRSIDPPPKSLHLS